MRLFLLQLILLFFVLTNCNAQYTITGNVNSSSYSCASFSGNSTIYIGNGTTSTNLSMNQTLDLYNSCSLGPIQFVVRNNASVDFSPGNERLVLPAGSSIIIESGGSLIGGSCNASERIYIGTDLIASCNGGAGADYAFNQLVINGGYNFVKTTVSPICGSGTASVAVSVIPTPAASTTYRLYTVPSGGSVVSSVTASTSPYSATLTTPSISATTTYYVAATTGSNTTPRKEFVVTVNSIPTITATAPSSICGSGVVTLGATASSGTINWYTTATGGSPVATGVTYNTPSLTNTTTYYVDATNGGCTTATRTAVVATVNNVPNNISNGFSATTICAGGSPQLTFDAEDATFVLPYSITYKNDDTSIQYTVSIPSAAPYSFTPADNPTVNTGYTLVSISNGTCTRTSGFVDPGSNLIVRPAPVVTISGTTSVCVGNSSPNITFTNPQTVAVTVTYTVNGGANQQINIPAGNTAAVAVPTSTATTYNYNLVSVVYQTMPGCSNMISGSATITVNPILPANVTVSASPSGAICSGTSVTFTAIPTNGGTMPVYQWKLNGGNVGLNSATYTNTALTDGDVVACVMTSNATPCLTASPATSNAVTMTVNLLPSAPVVGTVTQPTCMQPTGSVVLTNLPASGTWTINPGSYLGTGTATTISGLAVGTHTFTVSYGSCTSVSSVPVVISSPLITTYNGSSWSSTPDNTKVGVISGSGTIGVDTELCSCIVNTGVAAIVATGVTLKLQDNLVVNGSLTFENNASLVQVNNGAINSGNIHYKRHTAAVRRYDFTYWSSPVAGQTMKALSPNTLFDKYYSYNPNTGWKIEYNGVLTMQPGNGYIIRAPQTFSITTATVDTNPVFIGVPNNGMVNMTLMANKTYLLGNPYPSAIDADTFLDVNAGVLEGTLYFWTHNTPPNINIAGDAIYNYTSDDYATYNRTGGVSTSISAISGGAVPTGKIAAGQGFFAPASASGGNLVFNNAMRISGGLSGVNNSQFFKLNPAAKSAATTVTADKHRIWLNLTNNQGAFKQTLIGYLTGATNNYDPGYDGVTYNGNQFIDFYSINQGINLVIQGRALPFEEKDTLILGYKSTIRGDFKISIDHTDGIIDMQQVFLEDQDLQLLHDLKKEPYTFTTEKGTFNNRFVLRYQTKSNTDKTVKKIALVDHAASVTVFDKEIRLSSSESFISKVSIYDVSGSLIYQNEAVKANDFIIRNLNVAHQVLLINMVLANGENSVTKIVY
ncbi:hypothetical protein ABS764_05250 [Flavobacterium sp. ST-87]|uniref:Ig-like domain-containing protein n=1 Tax=Flavobacterium plantiphilum TaxID=3163297 RepID=A0ABW8XRD9_9FLAO